MALDYQAAVQELLDACRILLSMNGEHIVRSATTAAPPASPVLNDAWLLPANPTGAWAGRAGNIAQWNGSSWQFTAPTTGKTAFALDTGNKWQRSNTAWGIVPGAVSQLGVSGNLGDATGDLHNNRLPLRLREDAFSNTEATDADTMSPRTGFGLLNAGVPNGPGYACFYTYFGSPSNGVLLGFDRTNGQGHFRGMWNGAWQPFQRVRITEAEQDARYFRGAALTEDIGSTILARNANAAAGGMGSTVPGSALRPAKIMFNGQVSSHGTFLTSGTWRLCGAGHNAGDDDITAYRRVA